LEAEHHNAIERILDQRFVNRYLRTSAESAVQNSRFSKYAWRPDGMSPKAPIRFVVRLRLRHACQGLAQKQFHWGHAAARWKPAAGWLGWQNENTKLEQF
jgi:hypothetical protein